MVPVGLREGTHVWEVASASVVQLLAGVETRRSIAALLLAATKVESTAMFWELVLHPEAW